MFSAVLEIEIEGMFDNDFYYWPSSDAYLTDIRIFLFEIDRIILTFPTLNVE